MQARVRVSEYIGAKDCKTQRRNRDKVTLFSKKVGSATLLFLRFVVCFLRLSIKEVQYHDTQYQT